MLFDTDVLISFLRGNTRAGEIIGGDADRRISVVTYMELLQGARDHDEFRRIRSLLSQFAFQIVPLSENIGHRAAIYVEQHALRSRLEAADALIAATAVENDVILCTSNRRHYVVIADLQLSVFRP